MRRWDNITINKYCQEILIEMHVNIFHRAQGDVFKLFVFCLKTPQIFNFLSYMTVKSSTSSHGLTILIQKSYFCFSKLLQCFRKCCCICPPTPHPKATVPPWGDTHCMWLFNFAASLHLQHISAAVLQRYELSGQPVFAPGNGLFFFFVFYPLDPTADVQRYHFSRRKPPIKEQTLFYLFIFLL